MFTLFRHILLFELKSHILAITVALNSIYPKSNDIWYLLYRYDDEFRKYAMTPAGKQKYVENAIEYVNSTIQVQLNEPTHAQVKETKLFAKLHSINDEPAYKALLNNILLFEMWFYAGMYHREGDKPSKIDYIGKTLLWNIYDDFHRDNDRPSIIYHNEIAWYDNGRHIRSNVELPLRIKYKQASYAISVDDKMIRGTGIYNGAGAYNCPEFREYFGVDWPYFGGK